MAYTRLNGWRARAGLLGLVILLSCVSSAVADPKPLTKEEQEKVDNAIERAVAYLKRAQTKEGDWPRHWPKGYLVGQSALPAYAWLEAGVPANDPVIQKAADFLRPIVLKTDQTYELSLALLFFDRLGDRKDNKLIQTLALRLIASQHRTGGWSYRCLKVSEPNEVSLQKSLHDLSKQIERGQRGKEAVRSLEIPRNLRALAVFQDPEKLPWAEEKTQNVSESLSLNGITDNSNTQFAMLALWVAQKHNIPTRPTFCLLTDRFVRTQCEDGWWPYTGFRRQGMYPYRSMICVGLLALAIGDGLKLDSPNVGKAENCRLRILQGFSALYQEVGFPTGQMKRALPPQDLYFLWSVERVGMLYNLPMIGDKDWYRWGTEILLTNQMSGGGWKDPPRNPKYFVSYYGVTLNTAFALLFLKHSHPMKDLTGKLPFHSKELNGSITRLLAGEQPLNPLSTTPKTNSKPGP